MAEPDVQSAKDEIARELLQIHEDNYGTSAHNTDVHIDQDHVLVILDVDLTVAEQTLMDSGQGDAVKGMRESFQKAIAPNFKAVVERATGRTVADFFSGMSMDPPVYSIELFRLDPVAPIKPA